MAPFEQDLNDAARSIVVVSPYLQKGRIATLRSALQNAVDSGIDVVVYTRAAEQYDPRNQKSVCEAIARLVQVGITVQTYKELRQRYAIVDKSIVWYGSVDLLAFGRKDTDVLRFENPDVAGELLALSGEADSEQLMMEDISV